MLTHDDLAKKAEEKHIHGVKRVLDFDPTVHRVSMIFTVLSFCSIYRVFTEVALVDRSYKNLGPYPKALYVQNSIPFQMSD